MTVTRPRYYVVALVGLLVLLWGSVGLNRIGLGLILPNIRSEFGIDNLEASLLLAGTSVTWAFASWGGGWLSDHYGRRRVLLPAMAFICLMTAAMGLAGGFWSMFVIRDLLGVGDGIGWSVGEASIGEEVPERWRGVSQAIFTAGYTLIGAGLGAIIITRLTQHFGWRWAFPAIAAAAAIVVVALWALMREPAHRRAHDAVAWRSAVRLLRNPSLVLLTVMGCAILTWLQVFAFFDHSFLLRVRHFGEADAGDIAALWGFAGAAGAVVLPLLSDFVGRRPVVLLAALASAATLAVYLFAGLDKGMMQLVLGASGFCGFGLLPIVLATCVSEAVAENERGAALGVTNFFGVIIGTTLMPILAGKLADSVGLVAALVIPIAAQVVVMLLILGISETAPRVMARAATPALRRRAA